MSKPLLTLKTEFLDIIQDLYPEDLGFLILALKKNNYEKSLDYLDSCLNRCESRYEIIAIFKLLHRNVLIDEVEND